MFCRSSSSLSYPSRITPPSRITAGGLSMMARCSRRSEEHTSELPTRRASELGQFYIVAMHPVVADLEGRQTGALAFAVLQIDQVLAGVLADVLQVVQLAVVPFADHPAIADHRRGIVDDGPLQQ